MKVGLIIAAVLLVLGVGARSKFVATRQFLIAERKAIDDSWTGVDAALQSRAELIPSLADTVRRVNTGESSVFKEVEDALKALATAHAPAEKIAANDRLSGALARLLVLSENYPKLNTDSDFRRLQEQLADSENRIAVERRKYNELLERYNASIELFPNNIVSRISGFARNDAYFKTKVQF